jgi:hypothetical protein
MQQHLIDTRLELLRQRRAVREGYIDGITESSSLHTIKQYLKHVDHQLRVLKTDTSTTHRWMHQEELAEALAKGDSASAWQAARRLASPYMGPRNRWFSKLKKATPSMEEWTTAVQRPGLQGGCGAFEVSIEDVQEQEDTMVMPPLIEDYTTARTWYRQLVKRVVRAPFRKGIANDDYPAEILRLAITDPKVYTREAWRFPKTVADENAKHGEFTATTPFYEALDSHTRGEGIGANIDLTTEQHKGSQGLPPFS